MPYLLLPSPMSFVTINGVLVLLNMCIRLMRKITSRMDKAGIFGSVSLFSSSNYVLWKQYCGSAII